MNERAGAEESLTRSHEHGPKELIFLKSYHDEENVFRKNIFGNE